jgi:gliding motility-associated-like protein
MIVAARRILLIVILYSSFSNNLFAQCAAPISTFPYTEDFETTDGGWFTGGSNSDWQWGTPAKTTINSAGNGAKCWITGGLSGSSYNGNELSWLQSPCFNFSSLQYPYIQFKIFWETEKSFDGATFQYSTNNGRTWLTVGLLGETFDCMNDNWFNTSVRYLSPNVPAGWSGSIAGEHGCSIGGGSGSWVTAKQNISSLTGYTNVIFRFVFGAGTICNNYDGFAFDDISIYDSPPININTTVTSPIYCSNENNAGAATVNIITGSGPFIYSWNTSPVQNTQTATNLSPGNYVVTVTQANTCSAIDSVKIITTPLPAPVTTPDIRCGAGVIDLNATGTGSLKWYSDIALNNQINTGQNFNPLINSDTTYYVTATDINGCQSSVASVTGRIDGDSIKLSLPDDTAICPDGKLILNPGVFEKYLWQDGSTTSTYAVNQEGDYSIAVTNNKGCAGRASLQVRTQVNCSAVFFPNAFSPNGDGHNDNFGALGNLIAISNYRLSIYDRWGQIIFSNTDPYKEWDGIYQGQNVTGSFVWYATYLYKGQFHQTQKGYVTIIR